MTLYRFALDDPMNPWARELAIEAPDEDEARRRATSWMFARRSDVVLSTIGEGT